VAHTTCVAVPVLSTVVNALGTAAELGALVMAINTAAKAQRIAIFLPSTFRHGIRTPFLLRCDKMAPGVIKKLQLNGELQLKLLNRVLIFLRCYLIFVIQARPSEDGSRQKRPDFAPVCLRSEWKHANRTRRKIYLK
jgi:hypothetical protein